METRSYWFFLINIFSNFVPDNITSCVVLCFRNLAKSQQRLVKLGNALDKVDREVAEMRKRYKSLWPCGNICKIDDYLKNVTFLFATFKFETERQN